MQQLFGPVVFQSHALTAASALFGNAQICFAPDAAILAACGKILQAYVDL